MELLSVGMARSIWLFDVNEINPKGKSIFPDVLGWLGEKYSFQSFPKSTAEVDKEKKGFVFKTGEFQTNDGPITVDFYIYNDGLVAETWASTEKGDQFLTEILHSAGSKYGLAFRSDLIQRKVYVSEVTIRLDNDLSKFGQHFTRYCESLDLLFSRHHLPPFEMIGMSFSPDASAMSYKPPGLIIERKHGVPFGENRFWSKSPFATKDHLFALEEFEKLLAD